jgi:hypothetical protein
MFGGGGGGGGGQHMKFSFSDSGGGGGGFPGGGSFNFGGFPGGGFPGGGFSGGGFPGGGFGQQQHQQQQQPTDLFPKGQSKVTKLGQPKFPDKKSKHLWLIMFYDPEIPECHEAAQFMEVIAAKSAFKVGAIDCSHPREAKFCASKLSGSTSFPEFTLVVDGIVSRFENDDDELSAKVLHNFVNEKIPKSLVQNINSKSQLSSRLLGKGATKSSILLLTDKYETSTLYYAIAYQFRSTFQFGESRAKNLELAKAFQVKKYPLLIAFVPKGYGKEKYNDQFDVIRHQGSMKQDAITKWLKEITKRAERRERGSTGL